MQALRVEHLSDDLSGVTLLDLPAPSRAPGEVLVSVLSRDGDGTAPAELLATRLDDRRFQVVTLEPLVINAEDFDLLPGLESLRKFARLKSINPSVPVSAVLIFTAR